MKNLMRVVSLAAVAALTIAGSAFAKDAAEHRTGTFAGPKANTGMAVHFYENGKPMLKVTDDFKVPDTPAPTWRVIDTKGNIYTLDAFKIKGTVGSSEKRQVAVPAYIHDIAKVQVYCAWAEVVLGEASFAQPVKQ
jgi:hypothetical protein